MAKLWGGRFKKNTHPLVERFTKSIHYDYKIAQCDLLGSMAHVEILRKSGYLTSAEASKLHKGLGSIYAKVKDRNFKPGDKYEDIHTFIQNELQAKIGDLALKLHTARSRNDQVVFATKIYSKLALAKLQADIAKLTKAINLLAQARKNINMIIPGFTHLQHAQPVYLKDYLTAYVEMLKRDIKRLHNIDDNLKVTLGAGALAGVPIESAKYNIEASKFFAGIENFTNAFNIEPVSNTLDSVSDRDFVIEIISALSIIAMHLSRLAEDLIIWSSKEFDFIEIDEAFCTGSSLMPQKKNPDVLELVRGYAGRIYGNLVSVLTMMKGLPLTYNRDMQLDKEPLFGSFEIISQELEVLIGIIKTLKFNRNKIMESLKDESLYATDLVYYLVDKGIPFKQAHTIIGKLLRYSTDKKIEIKDLAKGKLKQFSGCIVKKEIVKLFDPEVSVKSKKSVKRK